MYNFCITSVFWDSSNTLQTLCKMFSRNGFVNRRSRVRPPFPASKFPQIKQISPTLTNKTAGKPAIFRAFCITFVSLYYYLSSIVSLFVSLFQTRRRFPQAQPAPTGRAFFLSKIGGNYAPEKTPCNGCHGNQ